MNYSSGELRPGLGISCDGCDEVDSRWPARTVAAIARPPWELYAIALFASDDLRSCQRWLCGSCTLTADRSRLAAAVALASGVPVATGQYARALIIQFRAHRMRAVFEGIGDPRWRPFVERRCFST